MPVPDVLRWGAEKYRLVVSQHERDLLVTRDLSRHLNDWRYHGEETGEHAGNQRILFQDETGRWYAASIGPLRGSFNVVTIIGSRRRAFLANRIRGMKNVVKGGK